jgi:hypothetical protein
LPLDTVDLQAIAQRTNGPLRKADCRREQDKNKPYEENA